MCFTEKKKTRFGFQKAFFQKVHLEKGGVVLYLGQYGIMKSSLDQCF